MLPLIEERMKRLIKREHSFKTMEMVPVNASSFFDYHGNKFESHRVKKESGFIQVVQYDRFAGRSPGSVRGDIEYFKLAAAYKYDKWVRIVGTTSKDHLKGCKNLTSHLKIVEKHQLLMRSPTGWIWLPRGEVIKQLILDRARKQFAEWDWITTPTLNEKELFVSHQYYGKPSAEIVKLSLNGDDRELLNPSRGTDVRLFNAPATSFLPMIAKFLTIFDFEFDVVKLGNRGGVVEFRLKDGLGRVFVGPRLSDQNGKTVVSLFNSLERFVALLLEKNKGDDEVETVHLEQLIERLRKVESQ